MGFSGSRSAITKDIHMKKHAKALLIATVYGLAAGAIAALVFALMNGVQHLLWSHPHGDRPLYIIAVIMAGGALIALLHHLRHQGSPTDGGMQQQLDDLHGTLQFKKRDTLLIAASAIVAVGFGGAIGPEAGLLAVVAECSAIIGLLLSASYQEQRLIRDTGAVAALSGLYGAPPGAAVLVDEQADGRKDTEATPLALKFLAGICGLLGFWLTHGALSDKPFQQLPLPGYQLEGIDALYALPAAVGGALLGLAFRQLHHRVPQWLARTGGPIRQIFIASGIFALMAASLPLLRFSGHHELEHALEHGIHAGVGMLLLLALGKITAMAVCLAGGWRGGEFFPGIFAAAALGAAVHLLLPGVPLTVAIMGATGAMLTVSLGKPMAVLLLVLLFAGTASPGALLAGIVLGHFVHGWAKQRENAHAGH